MDILPETKMVVESKHIVLHATPIYWYKSWKLGPGIQSARFHFMAFNQKKQN